VVCSFEGKCQGDGYPDCEKCGREPGHSQLLDESEAVRALKWPGKEKRKACEGGYTMVCASAPLDPPEEDASKCSEKTAQWHGDLVRS